MQKKQARMPADRDHHDCAASGPVESKFSWWYRLYGRLFCLEEWNIGVIVLPAGGLKELIGRRTLSSIRWRPRTQRSSYVADPFVWQVEGGARVMVEEFDYCTGRGRIRSISLQGLLGDEPMKDEIVPDFHASYPFVFHAGGLWYCLPESSESLTVNLYVWNSMLDRWNFKHRLLSDIAVYDPTLIAYDGLWYLFGTNKEDGPHSKLRIWWSDSLEGVWQPHTLNPVKTSADQVRSAGAIFRVDDQFYRPSQDCRKGYGHGLILNRIDVLSRFEYRETPVSHWYPDEPSQYGHGLHTISFAEDVAVIDGKQLRFSVFAAAWKVWWRARAVLRRATATLFGRAPAI